MVGERSEGEAVGERSEPPNDLHIVGERSEPLNSLHIVCERSEHSNEFAK